MISKELLSEVLDKTIKHYTKRENNIICFSQNYLYKDADTVEKPINIHELAHKCKEWALSNEYWIKSGLNNPSEIFNHKGYCTVQNFEHSLDDDYGFKGDSEPEAIFKACEWILNNK